MIKIRVSQLGLQYWKTFNEYNVNAIKKAFHTDLDIFVRDKYKIYCNKFCFVDKFYTKIR